MEVTDATNVFLQHRYRVATTKCTVARIKQKMRRGTCCRHKRVDFLGAFDNRAHVMVIDQGHTLTRQILRKLFEFGTKGDHFIGGQRRTVIHGQV